MEQRIQFFTSPLTFEITYHGDQESKVVEGVSYGKSFNGTISLHGQFDDELITVRTSDFHTIRHIQPSK